MSNRSFVRTATRLLGALGALTAVVAGLPALLVAAASRHFGHVSPLHGVNAPWRWTLDDLRSWGRQLTEGLDSSAELADVFFRIALIIGWACAAILIYTVIDEVSFQIRHGMPSAHHRRLVGLGPLGRNLATALVALFPLSLSSTTPALASWSMKAPVTVVQHRVPQLDDPVATSAPDQSGGWSLLEVQRGDSIWAIAERVAEGRDIGVVARQIVAANLGTVMADGHRFSTPALIEPGWLLKVPVAVAIVVATAPPVAVPAVEIHVVEAGDSYWDIAETRLGPVAAGSDIAEYTERLIAINAPLLGYTDVRLLRPGDVVQLGEPSAPPIPAPSATTASIDPPPAVDGSVPAVVADSPPVASDSPASVEPLPAASFPPPSTPPAGGAAPPVIAEHRAEEDIARGSGLAAAVVLASGAVAALGARRRQQLRGARVGARLVPPTEPAVETEMLLRSLSTDELLARIDVALRSAAPELAIQGSRPLAVEISDEGEIRLYTDRPAVAVSPRWLLDPESSAWRLPADVSLAELAGDARRANQPCPAIVHIGTSAGGQLFVDLEAVGSLSVDAAPSVAASIVRCAAASLAVSPFAESSRVFTVGLGVETRLGSPNVESLASVADAIGALRASSGSTAAATAGSVTTFAMRTESSCGEAWEPSLLLAVGTEDPAELAALVSLAGSGGRGVGVMFDRLVPGSGAVLRADDIDFVLEPLGRRVSPVGLTPAEVSAVDDLLACAGRPLQHDVEVVAPSPIRFAEFAGRAHEFVVHVFGQVAVQSAAGVPVPFDRSKGQELVVWLSQHRRRPTRASARTALWDLAVRDATFSNVVSDARRAMARVVSPHAGQEWIGRTMNEDLPLHDLVVTDAELLAERVAAARGLCGDAAIDVLRPGVALIEGMPFSGTAYLWPDAEGIASALVVLATTAAAELAAHYLSVDDVEGVFWSTGQGLKVLAGHEELIALRMRAHAHRGDLSGVRSEWESYERAIHADSWAAAEPSPKLVELRRELLAPSMVA